MKQALRWVRENIAEYGGDPGFVAITGGSAGGHLCALAALTANQPEFQPGFEEVDTTVQAAVPFYGAYDFTNSQGHAMGAGLVSFLERLVFKKKLAEDPQGLRAGLAAAPALRRGSALLRRARHARYAASR